MGNFGGDFEARKFRFLLLLLLLLLLL